MFGALPRCWGYIPVPDEVTIGPVPRRGVTGAARDGLLRTGPHGVAKSASCQLQRPVRPASGAPRPGGVWPGPGSQRVKVGASHGRVARRAAPRPGGRAGRRPSTRSHACTAGPRSTRQTPALFLLNYPAGPSTSLSVCGSFCISDASCWSDASRKHGPLPAARLRTRLHPEAQA